MQFQSFIAFTKDKCIEGLAINLKWNISLSLFHHLISNLVSAFSLFN